MFIYFSATINNIAVNTETNLIPQTAFPLFTRVSNQEEILTILSLAHSILFSALDMAEVK